MEEGVKDPGVVDLDNEFKCEVIYEEAPESKY